MRRLEPPGRSAHGKRGQPSRYLNGGANALMRAPSKPRDEQQAAWPRATLEEMDARFAEAMARALRTGQAASSTPIVASVEPRRR